MKPKRHMYCACRRRRWCGVATVAGWQLRKGNRCWMRLLAALEYKLFDQLYELP